MKKLYACLLFLFAFNMASAQCPVANSCTPGQAPASAHPFGMGIYSVAVGSGPNGFSNATGGVTDGYQDYSCNKKATVLEGTPVSIAITTNPNVNENVRVWVDLNNNGTFEAATELMFSSNNARNHSGTFTIPVAAAVVKNQVLRMRISADNFSSPVPTPCSTPAYSQVEDYGLTVLSNSSKPTVNFSVNNPVTCSPAVQFTELTQNGATSYLWDFGDNTTSTAANPAHTYAATGTYTVKLKACNANGCDSLTRTNYITYHTNVPVAASCTPATTSFCCGYGITRVTFSNMTNPSQNGAAGYEDFTCTKTATVMEGQTYQLAVETSPLNSQDTWAYLDYNNNGIFEASELVFTKLNAFSPTGSITIGWGAPHNTPLRLRIISDAQGRTASPCTNLISGQAEDYTVIITPNTRKPIPAFTTSFTNPCDSVIRFTEASMYQPTSFVWDFGDGSPKVTTRNPTHKYTATGAYTIKLKACNNIGCDSITKINYIAISKPCQTYCPFVSSNNDTVYFINRVKINTLDHSSGYEPNYFGNYTNLSTALVQGNTYLLEVNARSSGIFAYIDFNQDGDFFDYNESFFQRNNIAYKYTLNIPVPAHAKPGITRLRIISTRTSAYPYNACSPYFQSDYEVEEYSLLIQPNAVAPIARFYTPTTSSCSFTTAFADTSANSPTSWLWNFGDPNSTTSNTSTLQNPTHTFSAAGTYSITLTTCKGSSCNTVVKNNYITITGNNGPKTTTCIPKTFFKSPNLVTITNVTLGSMSHNFINPTDYTDFSCTRQVTLLPGTSYPITAGVFVDARGYYSNCKAWLDYNDDGYFNPVTELIFSSNNTNTHSGTFIPSNNSVKNKPLRLRFMADYQTLSPIPEPCIQPLYGVAIDYAVIITGPTGGIESNLLSQELKIYPNPSTGTFSLEIPTILKGNYHLEVQSLIGQTVAKQALKLSTGRAQQIELKQLPKGVYLLKVFNEKASTVKRLIIE